MDLKTEEILKLFYSHLRIENFLKTLCYIAIACGILIYIFYAFDQSTKIKLVKNYKKNAESWKSEKIMINPSINFQHTNDQVYHISAKKSVHKDNEAATLFDVFVTGEIGNITAGELEIDDGGDHLVFTKNPVLILNKTDNDK